MSTDSNNVIVELQLTAYKYRGQIINDLIHLERLIDESISRHFCSDAEKKTELMELILCNERISFHSKIQVFQYIFDKHKKEFVSNNLNIFSDIKKLNDERNIIAHYLLDTSETGKKTFKETGNIGFVKFRNSTETIWRTNSDYNNYHSLTVNYIRAIENYLLAADN